MNHSHDTLTSTLQQTLTSLKTLSDWMRDNTGPRDGTMELLVAADATIKRATELTSENTANSTHAQPHFAGFGSPEDALAYRGKHGGWIFRSHAGAVIWFAPTFTPSTIFTHSVTHGQSGELL